MLRYAMMLEPFCHSTASIALPLVFGALFFAPTIEAFRHGHKSRWRLLSLNIYAFNPLAWYGLLIWARNDGKSPRDIVNDMLNKKL